MIDWSPLMAHCLAPFVVCSFFAYYCAQVLWYTVCPGVPWPRKATLKTLKWQVCNCWFAQGLGGASVGSLPVAHPLLSQTPKHSQRQIESDCFDSFERRPFLVREESSVPVRRPPRPLFLLTLSFLCSVAGFQVDVISPEVLSAKMLKVYVGSRSSLCLD